MGKHKETVTLYRTVLPALRLMLLAMAAALPAYPYPAMLKLKLIHFPDPEAVTLPA
jgi:hypothetical protein